MDPSNADDVKAVAEIIDGATSKHGVINATELEKLAMRYRFKKSPSVESAKEIFAFSINDDPDWLTTRCEAVNFLLTNKNTSCINFKISNKKEKKQ